MRPTNDLSGPSNPHGAKEINERRPTRNKPGLYANIVQHHRKIKVSNRIHKIMEAIYGKM